MRNTLVLENSFFQTETSAVRPFNEELLLKLAPAPTVPSESRAEAPSAREILSKAFAYAMTFVLGLALATAVPVRTRTVEATQVVKQCPDGMTCMRSVVLDDSVRQAMLTARVLAGLREP